MTRKMTKPLFPYALMSSTLGTILVSTAAVWLATSAYAPVSRPDATSAQHSQFPSSSSQPLYRLSPSPLAPTGPLSSTSGARHLTQPMEITRMQASLRRQCTK